MSEKGYMLRPLLVRDHHAMADLGILARPYSAARAKVQAWLQAEPKNHCFAVESDGAFLGAVCCFIEPRAAFSARVELYLHEGAQSSVGLWIDDLITRCFDLGLHRLELLVPTQNKAVIGALEAQGFEQDGLLRDALPLEAAWQDAALYSILREEHGPGRFTFLPIATSVLVIYGDDEVVYELDFIQFGEKLEAGKRFDAAFAAGVIDRHGVVLQGERADLKARLAAGAGAGDAGDGSKGRMGVLSEAHLTNLPRAVAQALNQVTEYLIGERQHFDFPFVARGTTFQSAIWAILREIPYGATRSYMEVALEYIGDVKPDLNEADRRRQAQNISRAVGMACGANPLCLITPCHRVLGQNLKLTGFSGGIETKAYLLDLELMHRVTEGAEAD